MSRKKIIMILVVALVPILYFSVLNQNDRFSNENMNEQVKADDSNINRLHPTMIASAVANPQSIGNLMTAQQSNQTMSPIERIRAIKDKTELYKAAVQEYDNFSRYPGNNITISSAEQDPLVQRFSIDERTTLNDDKTAALTVWSDQVTYQRGEKVSVFAKLTDVNGVPLKSKFVAQLIYNGKKNIQSFDLQDNNLDGTNEFSFVANELNGKLLKAGIYKAIIVNDANELVDSVAFMLSDPGARFTGEYRDSLSSQGGLVIEAEVEVTTKDRFYLQASLYTELGDPIGITQMTASLQKGRHWLSLEFFGLMLRDSGVNGPYLLKNISLARVTMPMQRAPLIHPQYFTQPYELSQFSAQKYSDIAQLN